MNPFVERHQDKISGVLTCFDRVIITGTLPDISHSGAMAGYLSYHQIRLFDYPRWAEPLRDELCNHAEQLATEAGIEIEFIRRHLGALSPTGLFQRTSLARSAVDQSRHCF
jgi:hypothetical protein